jgi:hypothetical protein
MLRPDRGITRAYLHRAPVDMRKYAANKNMRSAWWRTRISVEMGSFTALHKRRWRV